MEKMLLTIEEAAGRLSIGRTKAYELVATGQLPSVTIGRCRRVTVEALHEFVSSLEVASGAGDSLALLSNQHAVADRGRSFRYGEAPGSPDDVRPQNRGRFP